MLESLDLDDLAGVVLPSDFEYAGTPSEIALDLDDLLCSYPGLLAQDKPHQAPPLHQAVDQFRWHAQLCEETTSSTASEAAGAPQTAPPGPAAGATGSKIAGKVQRRAEQNRYSLDSQRNVLCS